MDDQKYPRANWPYLISVAVMATMGLAFCGWALTSQVYGEWSHGQPISGGFSWPRVAAFDVGIAVALLALYWKIYRDANTVITRDGISQPGLGGMRTIAWPEIARVKTLGSLGCRIHSERTKIVITTYAYANPAEVIETLRAKFMDHHIRLS
jgi:hypothetical protein